MFSAGSGLKFDVNKKLKEEDSEQFNWTREANTPFGLL
jgi:hypothetical protein